MTERWQREVRKLHELGPSADVWDDAAARTPGTSADADGPSARKRVIAGVLAIAVFIAAGLFAWEIFRPSDPLPPAQADASDVLRIRCDAQSIDVLTPVVEAQPDGVHVLAEVSGIRQPQVLLSSKANPTGLFSSGAQGVDDVFVVALPPGLATASCLSIPLQSGGPTGSFSVVDPEGVFKAYHLTCEDPKWAGTSRNDLSDVVPAATPEEAFALHVNGLMAEDVIEPAGYPMDASRWDFYRLTREGQVIGWFVPDRLEAGGYYVTAGRVCRGYGLKPSRGSS
jgi:hypothetical protein